jgi:predicted negative regulator of RcsB-dependent stress response
MHVNVFTDGELLLIIGITGLVVWYITRYWTMRQIGQAAPASQHNDSLLEPIQAENAKLRALVERQEGRIRSLETIATDPAERTAREIEALRDA